MKNFIILVSVYFAAYTAFAQTEATTADGKKILVYPDGTWKSVAEPVNQKITPVIIPNLELPKPSPTIKSLSTQHIPFRIIQHSISPTG